ncbi:MAG: BON domain-containing protein [Patescibacteria group bacterium]|jgi:osmotically-inducible protein OsmY
MNTSNFNQFTTVINREKTNDLTDGHHAKADVSNLNIGRRIVGHFFDVITAKKLVTAFDNNYQLPRNAKINILVDDGKVTLHGEVPDRNAFLEAYNTALRVVGMSSVRNRLNIAN